MADKAEAEAREAASGSGDGEARDAGDGSADAAPSSGAASTPPVPPTRDAASATRGAKRGPAARAEPPPLVALLTAAKADRDRRRAAIDAARRETQAAMVETENLGRGAVTAGMVRVLQNQRALEDASKGLKDAANGLHATAAAWKAQVAASQRDAESIAGVEGWALAVENDIAALLPAMEDVARRLESGT